MIVGKCRVGRLFKSVGKAGNGFSPPVVVDSKTVGNALADAASPLIDEYLIDNAGPVVVLAGLFRIDREANTNRTGSSVRVADQLGLRRSGRWW